MHKPYPKFASALRCIVPERPIADLYCENLNLRPRNEIDKAMLGKDVPLFQSYIANDAPADENWHTGMWGQLMEIPPKTKVPVLVIDGWFDHHLDGTMIGWGLLPEETRAKSRMILGPWDHLATSPGNLDYPHGQDAVGTDCIKANLESLDSVLAGNTEKTSHITVDFTLEER